MDNSCGERGRRVRIDDFGRMGDVAGSDVKNFGVNERSYPILCKI